MDLQHVIELDSAYLFQNYARIDTCFTHGKGELLWDTEGREYLDLVAGIAVNVLGYAHPAVVAAICEQAKRLIHVSNLYRIAEQAELARKLAALLPDQLSRSLFVNSGTEANEAALKLAFKHTGRKRMVSTYNSFHGRTAGSLAATGQTKYHEGFEPLISRAFDFIDYGSVERLKEAVTTDTAAVILEAVQGEGGIVIGDTEFIKAARDVCDDLGALLILDEVQTGFGRTGKMFAFEHFGVVPDVITLAKAMGGGFPIGAMITSDELSRTLGPGAHGTTFGGSPLACSVAGTVLDVIVQERLPERAADLGARWLSELRSLTGGSDLVNEVRGKGLMVGMVMGKHARSFQAHAFDRGILVNVCGEKVMRMVPPLIIGEDSLKRLNDCLASFLEIG